MQEQPLYVACVIEIVPVSKININNIKDACYQLERASLPVVAAVVVVGSTNPITVIEMGF